MVVDKFRNIGRTYGRDILVVMIPLIVLFILISPLSDWLIDDAGISYAYARSLAGGDGLVSQPGMPPVEGYSNFLWVVLLAPFFAFGLFEPYVTDKIISLVLVAVTFWLIHCSLARLTSGEKLTSLIALLLLSMNSSFLVWTCSGLENPLFCALISLLLYLLLVFADSSGSQIKAVIVIGLVSLAVALTRPDGVIYVMAFPFVALLSSREGNQYRMKKLVRQLIGFAVSFGFLYGSFILFRYLYFGDLYPNTYYAKDAARHMDLVGLLTFSGHYVAKYRELFGSFFGSANWLLVPVIVIGFCASGRKSPHLGKIIVVATLTVLSIVAYMLLRADYMGEFRFATVVFPLIYIMVGYLIDRVLLLKFVSGRFRYLLAGVVVVAVLVFSALEHIPRLHDFQTNRPMTLASVRERFAVRFDNIADYLQLEDPSFLVPDIGGPLYYSKLRIHDLAGLCDRTIAKTRRYNQEAFYDYVFDTLAPSFIHTHGYFTAASRFDDDPRFEANYVALSSYVDEWVKKGTGVERLSGDFIRLDLVAGRETRIDSIQAGLF